MALKYDINKIFADLEKKIKKEKNKEEEEKENNPIESPEDAPKTDKVAPATSKTTEDTHGGDEASKEIKNSPNSINDGENSEKENKSEKTKDTGEKGKGKGIGEDEKKEEISSKDTRSKDEGKGQGNEDKVNNFKDYENSKKNIEKEKKHYFITKEGINPSKNKPKTTPEDLKKIAENIFEKKEKKQEDLKNENRQEYFKKYIVQIIKEIAAKHAGMDKQEGTETFDKKQMLQHIVKKQNYKILGDKYDLKDARYVQFFIDTSGVYGSGSNKIMHELMPEVISLLEKQGYECYIAACGNGFYGRDMVEDEYYHTRETLEEYKVGKVNKISCPTPETAAKMANEAEFSIILADFDGLSSICEMAKLCQKDKVPYFLCTEDRYPWEDPTYHDWVDPDMCDYNFELVYDVSMEGNPNTIEEYEKRVYDD